MTTFYTLKRNVKLLPGQIVGFLKGSGYYAKTVGKPAPKPVQLRSVGLAALAEAKKHIGVKESPPGTNRQSFGAWYGMNGVAWCAIFVSYCAYQATGGKVVIGGSGRGMSYVPTIEDWAKKTGRWRTKPAPGLLAIYNWDGGVPDHVGIVETVLSPTTFNAIEGNTAVGNDSNGGEVMRRNRSVSSCDGFVDLGTFA